MALIIGVQVVLTVWSIGWALHKGFTEPVEWWWIIFWLILAWFNATMAVKSLRDYFDR